MIRVGGKWKEFQNFVEGMDLEPALIDPLFDAYRNLARIWPLPKSKKKNKKSSKRAGAPEQTPEDSGPASTQEAEVAGAGDARPAQAGQRTPGGDLRPALVEQNTFLQFDTRSCAGSIARRSVKSWPQKKKPLKKKVVIGGDEAKDGDEDVTIGMDEAK